MKLSLIAINILVITSLFIGCGDTEESSEPEKKEEIKEEEGKRKIGYIVDSPISGLEYECCGSDMDTITKEDGKFECTTFPVRFKIGNYIIGTIFELPEDSKIYPQDIIGVDRSNDIDPKLIELTQFLQALDSDNDIEERITITQEVRDRFEKVYGIREDAKDVPFSCSEGFLSDKNNDTQNGNNGKNERPIVTPSDALYQTGIPQPNPQSAMDHLRHNINPTDYRPASTVDKSPYMGKWVGNGWNWEIRFKHSSGDFISQFSGIDTDELPMNKEKTIMSLLVVQENQFNFNVDANGDIKGTGTIVYDLIPNLCGVHALATQVNKMVDMLPKIEFMTSLGRKISQNTVDNFVKSTTQTDFTIPMYLSAHHTNKTARLSVPIIEIEESWLQGAVSSMLVLNGASGTFLGKDVGGVLMSMAKNRYASAQQSDNVCKQMGPKNIDDLWGGNKEDSNSIEDFLIKSPLGLDIMKALTFDLQNPLGLMLSIPGLTKIQYYYKGLENGPEKREFTFSGYIDDSGQMSLTLDNIEGSQDLTVEYMVNYKKELPTFPVWSPFLDKKGTVYPKGRDIVLYNYTPKEVEVTYFDDKEDKTKRTTVTTKELKTHKKNIPTPWVTFKDAGVKRDGVEVWHEYEYSWNAYKISDE